eukprot:19734-Heterococcus_DN1.PRE.1
MATHSPRSSAVPPQAHFEHQVACSCRRSKRSGHCHDTSSSQTVQRPQGSCEISSDAACASFESAMRLLHFLVVPLAVAAQRLCAKSTALSVSSENDAIALAAAVD